MEPDPTLSGAFPERIRKLWDLDRADNPDPSTLSPRSGKTIYLRCGVCGQKWRTTPHSISKAWSAGRSGCAACGQRVRKSSDDYHALAAKRGFSWVGPPVTNAHAATGWRCQEGHAWRAAYAELRKGGGCPQCQLARRKFNRWGTPQRNLRVEYPKIAAEWHPTKNDPLRPEDAQPQSNKRVWWLCARGHEWQTRIQTRALGRNCPYCSPQTSRAELRVLAEVGQLLQPVQHRAKVSRREVDVLLPAHRIAIEVDGWHHRNKEDKDRAKNLALQQAGMTVLRVRDKNLGRLSRDDVAVDFRDGITLRNIQSLVRRILRVAGSRLAVPERERLRAYLGRRDFLNEGGFQKLAEVLPGPLASRSLEGIAPELARQWHPTRNSSRLNPDNISAYSRATVWWQCASGHEWRASPHDRLNGGRKPIGCPYCPGAGVKVALRFGDSLAAKFPELIAEWHPTRNAELDPARLRPFSNRKAWWICPKGHEYQIAVANRTRQKQGCGFCSGARVSDDNCLATRHPDLAAEWHPIRNGNLQPTDVHAGSEQKVWWACPLGHEWQASVKSRSRLHSGCPHCWRERRKARSTASGASR